MTENIVERLQESLTMIHPDPQDVRDAINEIERLRHLVARLDNALSDIKHLTADPGVLHRIKEARRG